jgi:hypothetical protein
VVRMTGREALALGVTMLLALGHWVIVTRSSRVTGSQ